MIKKIMIKKKIQDVTICAVCLVLSSCCIIGKHSGVKRGNPPRNSSGFPGKIQAGMLHLLCLDSQLLLPPYPPWELRFCSLIYGIYFNLFQFIPPLTSMSDQPYKAIINIELLGSCWDLDKSLGGVQGNNHSRFFRVKKKKTNPKPEQPQSQEIPAETSLRICGIDSTLRMEN